MAATVKGRAKWRSRWDMRPVEQASIRQTAASSREPREGKPRGEKGLIFHTLRQIADAIVETFPRAFEVVIHDLSQPHKSIRHIVGDVTKRRAGGPVTDLVVKALQQEGETSATDITTRPRPRMAGH